MGDSRKYPYHNTATFLEFQGQRVRGWGGPMNWKSRHGGDTYCSIGIPKAWRQGGWLDLEFPQGTDKRLYHENAYFMDFKNSSQIKHELATRLTTARDEMLLLLLLLLPINFLGISINLENLNDLKLYSLISLYSNKTATNSLHYPV